ncbi:MAG: PTS sugar transporter subunit IIA [Treponema sp.]|nr:PTS sugar transporter subunit IIA [Treponema sp.]
MEKANYGESLARLVSRGGVCRNVEGGNHEEVLSNIIDDLPSFPVEKAEKLLRAVLEREALITTGAGRGIALPHPRMPLLEEGEEPFVTIAFPLNPVSWNALDGRDVHTVFLIVSESAKQHLAALSKINFLCQQEKFYGLLAARAPKEEIIAVICEAEKAWENNNYRTLDSPLE